MILWNVWRSFDEMQLMVLLDLLIKRISALKECFDVTRLITCRIFCPFPSSRNNSHFFDPDFVSRTAPLTAKELSSTLYQQPVNTNIYEHLEYLGCGPPSGMSKDGIRTKKECAKSEKDKES